MRNHILTMAFACALCAQAEVVDISVYNPGDFQRTDEMVEVDESAVRQLIGAPSFVIRDSEGKEVAWQKTHDGKIIFQANVAPGATAVYTAEAGEPAPVKPRVYGRLFRERCDDMTWENDRGAYRAYGPELQRRGERAFGYDVWTKSTPEMVLEKRFYLNNRKGVSFHRDHGDGMDVYTVGPTLGGGTAALLGKKGEIIYPWCWSEFEILEQGPLRWQVRLVYPPMTSEKGIPATEERIITLDAGEWLNRTDVTYLGLSEPQEIIAGQVVHKQNPKGYVLDKENGVTAYADLTENAEAGNGTIFVGTVAISDATPSYFKLKEPVGDAVGHAVLYGKVENGKPFSYLWGSGWSKGGMKTMDKWTKTLRHKSQCLKYPLIVKVAQHPEEE